MKKKEKIKVSFNLNGISYGKVDVNNQSVGLLPTPEEITATKSTYGAHKDQEDWDLGATKAWWGTVYSRDVKFHDGTMSYYI